MLDGRLNKLLIFDTGRLGLSTCYDVRFPEQYIELVKRGAQILLVPSAFTVPTGTAHWHVLLRGKCRICNNILLILLFVRAVANFPQLFLTMK
jgi:predicted amidohydrolase